MRGYESQQSHRADDDHLSRFEAEMDRLKTEREKAVQHAEDLGYQVEVLRAKLHEARRNLATRPAHDSADIGYQAEQMLRNAQLQAEQIARYRDAWRAAGHGREPRVSVSRSIFPIVSDLDQRLFWRETHSTDQVGLLDGGNARFGRTYAGEPDKLVAELAEDEAIAAADTLLLTVPNQLGVDYNAHVVESVLTHVAPELGWR